MSDDPNDTKIGYQAIKDIAKDALDRGVIDDNKADALVNNYAKNTESRKLVFKTRAILKMLQKNIFEYWGRYLLFSAGVSGGGAWSFRDTIETLLTGIFE